MKFWLKDNRSFILFMCCFGGFSLGRGRRVLAQVIQ